MPPRQFHPDFPPLRIAPAGPAHPDDGIFVQPDGDLETIVMKQYIRDGTESMLMLLDVSEVEEVIVAIRAAAAYCQQHQPPEPARSGGIVAIPPRTHAE